MSSHRLQVLISRELDDQLEKAAQRHRVSKGEWVRRALLESLRQAPAANPITRLASLNGPTANIDKMMGEIDAGRG